LKNAHLLRYPAASPSRRRGKRSLLIRRDTTPHPSSLQRTFRYASLLRISGALHLGIFDQPEKNEFFDTLLSLEFYGFLLPFDGEGESENRKALPQL